MTARIPFLREWLSYLLFLGIWAAGYFLPQIAMEKTEWYPAHFHLWQSTIPVLLIFSAYELTKEHWREWLGFVLLLQVLHNLGDILWDDSWQAYDFRQSVLNGMELAIIFCYGLTVLVYKTYRALRARHNPHMPDSGRRMVQSSEGLSRNVG